MSERQEGRRGLKGERTSTVGAERRGTEYDTRPEEECLLRARPHKQCTNPPGWCPPVGTFHSAPAHTPPATLGALLPAPACPYPGKPGPQGDRHSISAIGGRLWPSLPLSSLCKATTTNVVYHQDLSSRFPCHSPESRVSSAVPVHSFASPKRTCLIEVRTRILASVSRYVPLPLLVTQPVALHHGAVIRHNSPSLTRRGFAITSETSSPSC